jgi:endonuclease/exonuclease/phosphatase family metal-dependent hydrolase
MAAVLTEAVMQGMLAAALALVMIAGGRRTLLTSPMLRILTYNLHKGFSTANRRFELKRMREAIRATEADLVFLQEVQGEHRGHAQRLTSWIDEAQFEYLADSVWPHHAYGRNAVYDAGHHGNAILSRLPIDQVENIDLTVQPLEQRGVLHAIIAHAGRPVHLLCTHLDMSGFTRSAQLNRIHQRIRDHIPDDEPVILAGDFNDWRGQADRLVTAKLSFRDAHMTLHGHHARTFPSWFPVLRLDRVYLRGLRPLAAQRLVGGRWQGLSDHCGLLVDFANEL